jgi:hypothetical protein
MKTRRIFALMSFLLLPVIGVLTHFAFANPPEQKETVASEVPAEAAYPHLIRLRVVKVVPVEKTEKHQILKLDVERHYGKISSDSHKRAMEHETQRFSILFAAVPDAEVREGDLIDYRMVAFSRLGRE